MNKIALLIAEKGQQLALQLVPKIVDMARSLAIEKIGTALENMIPSCPPQEELQKLLNIRNQLVNKLNTTANTINTLSKTLKPLTETIDKSEKALQIAQTAEIATLLALDVLTIPVPSPVLSGLIKVDKLINVTLPPIITLNKNKISSIESAIDFTNNIILQLINLINSIDTKLRYCGVNNLDSYNDYINTLVINKENVPQNDIYKGFVLEIEITPYSPTVNRRRAVAKNDYGIVLLSTSYSFTTLDQVLINELKLIIDSNNLRAD